MELKVLNLGQLLTEKIKQREAILAPWFKERQACMIYAPTGLGKSMFSMSMALAIAGGGSFLDWSSKKPRKVLIVDGEMDMEDLRDRSETLMKSIEGFDEDTARKNLFFLARQGQKSDQMFPDINTHEGKKIIVDLVKKNHLDLVILDNFSTLAEIVKENEAHSFNGTLDLLKTLKQEACASMLIHHSRKDSNSYRGTSKIGVIFDSIIKLSCNSAIKNATDLSFDLAWEKVRTEKDHSMQTMTVMLSYGEDDLPKWSSAESQEDQLNRIISELKTLKYTSDKQIAEAIGIAPSTLTKKKRQIFSNDLLHEKKWNECIQHAKDNQLDAEEKEENSNDI
jgi:RecA-family ATPase